MSDVYRDEDSIPALLLHIESLIKSNPHKLKDLDLNNLNLKPINLLKKLRKLLCGYNHTISIESACNIFYLELAFQGTKITIQQRHSTIVHEKYACDFNNVEYAPYFSFKMNGKELKFQSKKLALIYLFLALIKIIIES